MKRIMYAPILKWKAGERAALENLDNASASRISPIVEIVTQADAANLVSDLDCCSGNTIYIDTAYDDDIDRYFLRDTISHAKRNGFRACPVLYYDDLLVKDLVEWVKQQEQVAIRIPVPGDLDGPEHDEIFSIIGALNHANVDLILDLGLITDKRSSKTVLLELRNMLVNFVTESEGYANIIIALTCFPERLTLDSGANEYIDRHEMIFFAKLLADPKVHPIAHRLVFSDYGVSRFTDTEGLDFSKLRYGIRPKIRYTTEKKYWVLKGKKDHTIGLETRSIFDMAKEIYDSEFYYGSSFSYGDMEIEKRALREGGPGNSANWVTFCVNHHISVVVDELSNLLGVSTSS